VKEIEKRIGSNSMKQEVPFAGPQADSKRSSSQTTKQKQGEMAELMKNPRMLHKEAQQDLQGPKQAGRGGHGLQHSKEDGGARERLGDQKGWQGLGRIPMRSSRRGSSRAAVWISKALTLSTLEH